MTSLKFPGPLPGYGPACNEDFCPPKIDDLPLLELDSVALELMSVVGITGVFFVCALELEEEELSTNEEVDESLQTDGSAVNVTIIKLEKSDKQISIKCLGI